MAVGTFMGMIVASRRGTIVANLLGVVVAIFVRMVVGMVAQEPLCDLCVIQPFDIGRSDSKCPRMQLQSDAIARAVV